MTTECRAPFTSMYFDQLGDVRSCCWNISSPLGNIGEQSIREIWDGAQSERLRDALVAGDFSQGCSFCDWQHDHGDEPTYFARRFDDLEISGPRPTWPRQLEFALTNACNLQCVMCTGWNSSAIRANREKLPPLPEVYGDAFFEELAEFLPHVQQVNLLGGEPFLCRSTMRVLEMIAALDRKPSVSVTTNATLWSPRIERVCDAVPMTYTVSLDAADPDVYRSIRVGAELDTVLTNLDRYQAMARRDGTQVGLTVCLMSTNAGELGGLLRLAESRELDFVNINVVTIPGDFSLHRLERDELERRVDDMERSVAAAALTRPYLISIAEHHVELFRRRVAEYDDGEDRAGSIPMASPWVEGSDDVERCVAWVREWAAEEPSYLRSDGRLVATDLSGPILSHLGLGAEEFVGRPMQYVAERLGAELDVHLSPTDPLSGLSNEVSLAGGRSTERVEVRSFLFTDGADMVVVMGVRRLRGSQP